MAHESRHIRMRRKCGSSIKCLDAARTRAASCRVPTADPPRRVQHRQTLEITSYAILPCTMSQQRNRLCAFSSPPASRRSCLQWLARLFWTTYRNLSAWPSQRLARGFDRVDIGRVKNRGSRVLGSKTSQAASNTAAGYFRCCSQERPPARQFRRDGLRTAAHIRPPRPPGAPTSLKPPRAEKTERANDPTTPSGGSSRRRRS